MQSAEQADLACCARGLAPVVLDLAVEWCLEAAVIPVLQEVAQPRRGSWLRRRRPRDRSRLSCWVPGPGFEIPGRSAALTSCRQELCEQCRKADQAAVLRSPSRRESRSRGRSRCERHARGARERDLGRLQFPNCESRIPVPGFSVRKMAFSKLGIPGPGFSIRTRRLEGPLKGRILGSGCFAPPAAEYGHGVRAKSPAWLFPEAIS